jgi:hypothetical protein
MSLDGDILLRIFAQFVAEDVEARLSLTLDVNGVLIGGDLINRDRWFDEMEKLLNERGNGPNPAAFARGLAHGFLEIDLHDTSERTVMSYEYLHLVNARCVNAPGASGLSLWRIRIGEVGAWSLGYVDSSEARIS